ncbi:MAG: homoserine kinase [Bacteroidetes bacterium]|jgi:homoserine kinase|nr:homoserine kinase [Bacteroidota bacterium]
MDRDVAAYAPATVSNVACGFDIMGFALDEPGDKVTVRFSRGKDVTIRRISGCTSTLPMNPARNTAGAPVIEMLKHCRVRRGVEIEIRKGLPAGSGIGSSAASAVAAAVACNALLGAGLSKEEILTFALHGEKIASGGVHVDNLSPSLWGGFILVRGYDPLDIVQIPISAPMWCVIVRPHMEIRTKESRKMLPRTVPLSDVVRQTGNAAGLVAGLMSGDFGLISRSLHDVIAEPARRHLIPGFADMKSAALDAGALGCSLSGSGPSVFALAKSKRTARQIGIAMGSILNSVSCPHSVIVSGISSAGARIIS